MAGSPADSTVRQTSRGLNLVWQKTSPWDAAVSLISRKDLFDLCGIMCPLWACLEYIALPMKLCWHDWGPSNEANLVMDPEWTPRWTNCNQDLSRLAMR